MTDNTTDQQGATASDTVTQDPATAGKARISGIGRLLVAGYGILALAATGRSIQQVVEHFDHAPVPYLLTCLAALVYIVATVALVMPGPRWRVVAWSTIVFELTFVLVVGTLSTFWPEFFPDKTVWSWFGLRYAFAPLILPVLGIIWLSTNTWQRSDSRPVNA